MTSLLDRQVEFTSYLVDGFPKLGLQGWDLAGGCAVTGNSTQENLCKPVTTGPKDHNSDGSLQWRDSHDAPRLTGNPEATGAEPGVKWGMQPWCMKYFGTWQTLEAQAAFTLYETQRDYPALDAELRKSMDGVKPEKIREVLDYKTLRFMTKFEKPKIGPTDGLKNRQDHAASVYMLMSNAKPPVVAQKPKVPVVVVGGGVVVAGGATTGVQVVQHGVTDPISIAMFVVMLAVAMLITYHYQAQKVTVAPPPLPPTPPEPLKDLLEQRTIIDAKIAERLDEIKEGAQELNDLVVAAAISRPVLTIDHQP